MTDIGKTVCYRSHEKEHTTPRRAPWGKHRMIPWQKELGENVGKSLDCGFRGKEWERQGKQV